MTINVGSTKCGLFTVALLLVMTPVPSVEAFNLTGTWQGKLACKVVMLGGTFVNKFNAELRISQPLGGSSIRAQWSPLINLFDESFLYRGAAIPKPSKTDQGEAVLTRCGTTETPIPFVSSEIVSWKVTTKPSTGKGGLKGTSLLMESQLINSDPLDGDVGSQTCKWSFKRVAVSDPLVAECGICGNSAAEFGEQCDGPDVGLSCADLGFTGGSLSCTPSCTFNTGACTP